MIIYNFIYLFVVLLNVNVAEQSSIRSRKAKNDLVPFFSSKTDLSGEKEENSLKIVSNEPFIIQLETTESLEENSRKEKGKRGKITKIRFPTKLKALRKKQRTRRDVQAVSPKGLKLFNNNSNKLNIKQQISVESLKESETLTGQPGNSIPRQKMFKAIDEAIKIDDKHEETAKEQSSFSWEKSVSGEESNEDEGFMDWLKKTRQIKKRHDRPLDSLIVGMVNPIKKSIKRPSRELNSNFEKLQGKKMSHGKKSLHGNDSDSERMSGPGPRVRRKSELDKSANKIAKMFLTLSAINSKRKAKCKDDYEEEYDDDDVGEDGRESMMKSPQLSSNEERYKVKKWIEHLKSRRSNKYCSCDGKDGNGEDDDEFPLENKVSKAIMAREEDKESDEKEENGTKRDKTSFSWSGQLRGRNGGNARNRYSKIADDIDEKLKAIRNNGKNKLALPLDDLEMYRTRARKILQNAEDILDKIKEEEEKRNTNPEYLLNRLKEITSRIHANPRNNENNDFIRLLQKNLGMDALHKIHTEDDGGSFSDTIKAYFTDPYEKARQLTEESAKQLSTFMLQNLAKLAENKDKLKEELKRSETKEETKKMHKNKEMYPTNGLRSDEKGPESDFPDKNSKSSPDKQAFQKDLDEAKQKLLGNKDIDEPLKKIIQDMLKEQQDQVYQLSKKVNETPENVNASWKEDEENEKSGWAFDRTDKKSEKKSSEEVAENHRKNSHYSGSNDDEKVEAMRLPDLPRENEQAMQNLEKEIADLLEKEKKILEKSESPYKYENEEANLGDLPDTLEKIVQLQDPSQENTENPLSYDETDAKLDTQENMKYPENLKSSQPHIPPETTTKGIENNKAGDDAIKKLAEHSSKENSKETASSGFSDHLRSSVNDDKVSKESALTDFDEMHDSPNENVRNTEKQTSKFHPQNIPLNDDIKKNDPKNFIDNIMPHSREDDILPQSEKDKTSESDDTTLGTSKPEDNAKKTSKTDQSDPETREKINDRENVRLKSLDQTSIENAKKVSENDSAMSGNINEKIEREPLEDSSTDNSENVSWIIGKGKTEEDTPKDQRSESSIENLNLNEMENASKGSTDKAKKKLKIDALKKSKISPLNKNKSQDSGIKDIKLPGMDKRKSLLDQFQQITKKKDKLGRGKEMKSLEDSGKVPNFEKINKENSVQQVASQEENVDVTETPKIVQEKGDEKEGAKKADKIKPKSLVNLLSKKKKGDKIDSDNVKDAAINDVIDDSETKDLNGGKNNDKVEKEQTNQKTLQNLKNKIAELRPTSDKSKPIKLPLKKTLRPLTKQLKNVKNLENEEREREIAESSEIPPKDDVLQEKISSAEDAGTDKRGKIPLKVVKDKTLTRLKDKLKKKADQKPSPLFKKTGGKLLDKPVSEAEVNENEQISDENDENLKTLDSVEKKLDKNFVESKGQDDEVGSGNELGNFEEYEVVQRSKDDGFQSADLTRYGKTSENKEKTIDARSDEAGDSRTEKINIKNKYKQMREMLDENLRRAGLGGSDEIRESENDESQSMRKIKEDSRENKKNEYVVDGLKSEEKEQRIMNTNKDKESNIPDESVEDKTHEEEKVLQPLTKSETSLESGDNRKNEYRNGSAEEKEEIRMPVDKNREKESILLDGEYGINAVTMSTNDIHTDQLSEEGEDEQMVSRKATTGSPQIIGDKLFKKIKTIPAESVQNESSEDFEEKQVLEGKKDMNIEDDESQRGNIESDENVEMMTENEGKNDEIAEEEEITSAARENQNNQGSNDDKHGYLGGSEIFMGDTDDYREKVSGTNLKALQPTEEETEIDDGDVLQKIKNDKQFSTGKRKQATNEMGDYRQSEDNLNKNGEDLTSGDESKTDYQNENFEKAINDVEKKGADEVDFIASREERHNTNKDGDENLQSRGKIAPTDHLLNKKNYKGREWEPNSKEDWENVASRKPEIGNRHEDDDLTEERETVGKAMNVEHMESDEIHSKGDTNDETIQPPMNAARQKVDNSGETAKCVDKEILQRTLSKESEDSISLVKNTMTDYNEQEYEKINGQDLQDLENVASEKSAFNNFNENERDQNVMDVQITEIPQNYMYDDNDNENRANDESDQEITFVRDQGNSKEKNLEEDKLLESDNTLALAKDVIYGDGNKYSDKIQDSDFVERKLNSKEKDSMEHDDKDKNMDYESMLEKTMEEPKSMKEENNNSNEEKTSQEDQLQKIRNFEASKIDIESNEENENLKQIHDQTDSSPQKMKAIPQQQITNDNFPKAGASDDPISSSKQSVDSNENDILADSPNEDGHYEPKGMRYDPLTKAEEENSSGGDDKLMQRYDAEEALDSNENFNEITDESNEITGEKSDIMQKYQSPHSDALPEHQSSGEKSFNEKNGETNNPSLHSMEKFGNEDLKNQLVGDISADENDYESKSLNSDPLKDWPLAKSQYQKNLTELEKVFEDIVKEARPLMEDSIDNFRVKSVLKPENIESEELRKLTQNEDVQQNLLPEEKLMKSIEPSVSAYEDTEPSLKTVEDDNWKRDPQSAKHPYGDDSLKYYDDPLMRGQSLPPDYDLPDISKENFPKVQKVKNTPFTSLNEIHHKNAKDLPHPQNFKMPATIEKIVSDLSGGKKKEIGSLQSLDPEQIDQFIDKIHEAEIKNIDGNSETDCIKQCACADEIDSRSQKIGRYEIVKDFLHWVKDLRLNRVLSDD